MIVAWPRFLYEFNEATLSEVSKIAFGCLRRAIELLLDVGSLKLTTFTQLVENPLLPLVDLDVSDHVPGVISAVPPLSIGDIMR